MLSNYEFKKKCQSPNCTLIKTLFPFCTFVLIYFYKFIWTNILCFVFIQILFIFIENSEPPFESDANRSINPSETSLNTHRLMRQLSEV